VEMGLDYDELAESLGRSSNVPTDPECLPSRREECAPTAPRAFLVHTIVSFRTRRLDSGSVGTFKWKH
jgi:hypothetical protein